MGILIIIQGFIVKVYLLLKIFDFIQFIISDRNNMLWVYTFLYFLKIWIDVRYRIMRFIGKKRCH